VIKFKLTNDLSLPLTPFDVEFHMKSGSVVSLRLEPDGLDFVADCIHTGIWFNLSVSDGCFVSLHRDNISHVFTTVVSDGEE